jgi:flagellar protein FliS
MLYDGALRFLAEARSAIERRDVPARRVAMGRALAIVSELQNTLNMEAGGEISAELDRLYSFVTMRLTDASSTQDVKPLDEAVRVLSTLREGWVGISWSAALPQPLHG